MVIDYWYCDVCQEKVTKDNGYVVWNNNPDSGFNIIHRGKCDKRGQPSSSDLESFLGVDGLAYLTSFISYGEFRNDNDGGRNLNKKSFIDFFRRVQLPYYEEARRKFSSEEVQNQMDGSNEYSPYVQSVLKNL